MATNFPYFKFTSSLWLTGDIVFEDLDTQGLFINICALYWQRDGQITISDIEKRFSATVEKAKLSDRLAKLSDRFFYIDHENEDKICIKFLDEQLFEISVISAKNSENGKKGGRPKELNIKEKKAKKSEQKRPLSETKRPPSKEEKKRKELEEEVEKKRKEVELEREPARPLLEFELFWNLYQKKIGAEVCRKKWDKLKESDKVAILEFIPKYIEYEPDTQFRKNPETFLNQKSWMDELPKRTKFNNNLKPTARPVSDFSDSHTWKL